MASSLPMLKHPDIPGGPTMAEAAAAAEDGEDDMLGIDDLLVTLSAAADASLIAAEAATEAERLAAIAAEEAAEAYLAASAAVGTDAFAGLRDIAEAAERNTEELTSAAALAYKTYFLACAQSMDASAAVEAEAALHGGAAQDEDFAIALEQQQEEKAEVPETEPDRERPKSVGEKPSTPASKAISKLPKPSKLVLPQPDKPCMLIVLASLTIGALGLWVGGAGIVSVPYSRQATKQQRPEAEHSTGQVAVGEQVFQRRPWSPHSSTSSSPRAAAADSILDYDDTTPVGTELQRSVAGIFVWPRQ